MNIVYNCNDAFAVHTAVSIVSLFENNREAGDIEVYILANSVSGESKARLRGLSEEYRGDGQLRKVHIIELEDYAGRIEALFGGSLDTAGFDLTVLARLFAPSYLPKEVARYIYLDADTIVLRDIDELWETKLNGAVCGMVTEPTIYKSTRQKIGLKSELPYYNSGMLLVDRCKWEEEDISKACAACFASFGRKGLSFPDQDILNTVLKGRVKTLPQKWNFFSNYHYRSYRSLIKEAAWYADELSETQYNEARRHPAIVHFAGAERPWLRGNHNPYKDSYRAYLALTPWREMQEQRGQELNMQLYHCMNLLTLVCPAARGIISGVYIRLRQRT